MSALVLDGVRYGRALADYHLRVAPGETVVLSGGAGTFDVFRLALGLVRPDAGRVTTLGVDPSALGRGELARLRARCAVVPHVGALLSNSSIRVNVGLPLRYHRLCDRAEVDGRVRAALERVGLEAHADRRPAELSGQERRLAALARAWACAPELVLLRDPYEGMAEDQCARTEAVLAAFAERGAAVVITTGLTALRTAYGGRLSERAGARVVRHVGAT